VIQLNNVSLGYGERVILKNITLNVSPTDRIGLLGANGAGKSTLIKALAGELVPIDGVIVSSPKLSIGYFNQHQVEALNIDETPFWHLKRLDSKLDPQQIRTFLGSFGFKGDKCFEKVGVFSGGEKARLVLALLAWQKPHLLLLDEPTNHLDLEMREALALALQSFEGAVIVVSHDRQILSSVVDNFLLIDNGKLVEYDEDLDAYAQWIFAQRKKNADSIVEKEVAVRSKPTQNPEIAILEKKIKKAQDNLAIVMSKLETIDYKNPQFQALCDSQKKIEIELALLEEQWLSLSA
jgi:ATP-binding cassette subfamily F protein 3